MVHTQSSNAISTLLVDILGSVTHPLALEMAEWMSTSKRFRVFAEAYRDKIRKKVRTLRDREGLSDLRCELAMAYFLLQEPRLSVQYELQSANKQRAPDFTVTFRENLPFHLEVTRLHARPREGSSAPGGADARLANALSAKLGQMQSGAINVLALFAEGDVYGEADIVATTRALLRRASGKEEAYFAWHGFSGSRDFLHRYQRLSGILLVAGSRQAAGTHTVLWENNQARQPIPGAIRTILGRVGANGA